MPKMYFDGSVGRATNHLISSMNRFPFGSEEYEMARKAFAFIVTRERTRQKLDYEHHQLSRRDAVGDAPASQ